MRSLWQQLAGIDQADAIEKRERIRWNMRQNAPTAAVPEMANASPVHISTSPSSQNITTQDSEITSQLTNEPITQQHVAQEESVLSPDLHLDANFENIMLQNEFVSLSQENNASQPSNITSSKG